MALPVVVVTFMSEKVTLKVSLTTKHPVVLVTKVVEAPVPLIVIERPKVKRAVRV